METKKEHGQYPESEVMNSIMDVIPIPDGRLYMLHPNHLTFKTKNDETILNDNLSHFSNLITGSHDFLPKRNIWKSNVIKKVLTAQHFTRLIHRSC